MRPAAAPIAEPGGVARAVAVADEDDFFVDRSRWKRRAKRIGVVAVALVGLWALMRALSSPAAAEPAPAAPVVISGRALARVTAVPRPEVVVERLEFDVPLPKAPPARKPRAHVASAPEAAAAPVEFPAPPPVMPRIEVIAPAAPKTEKTEETEEAEAPPDAPAPEPKRSREGLARPNVLLWTEPGGAMAKLNGRYVGRTPLNVEWDIDQPAEIELDMAGYVSQFVKLTPESSSGLMRILMRPSDDGPSVLR